MKQELNINNTKITIEITPQKLYGKIFSDWVEEKYRGVLPKLTITKRFDSIINNGYDLDRVKRIEEWEVNWRYQNDSNHGTSKTITMCCCYLIDGSIDYISYREGLFNRGNDWSSKSEKGLKISTRNIVKKFLNNPNYRGNPTFYKESEMFTSQY
jgi:hypothetical protein